MPTSNPHPDSENSDSPYRHSRGFLPHIENKQIQFLTFRLYDSVPKKVIQQWKVLLANEEEKVRNESFEEEERLRQLIDQYEDAGFGECFLQDSRVASIVENTLKYFDNQRYTLLRWCIMPNHVHVLIDINTRWSLSSIVNSWKSFTAHESNRILGRNGQFWMTEYYDRYIRTPEHVMKTVLYIDYNPVKAGLCKTPMEWEWSTKSEYLERIGDYDYNLNKLNNRLDGRQLTSLDAAGGVGVPPAPDVEGSMPEDG